MATAAGVVGVFAAERDLLHRQADQLFQRNAVVPGQHRLERLRHRFRRYEPVDGAVETIAQLGDLLLKCCKLQVQRALRAGTDLLLQRCVLRAYGLDSSHLRAQLVARLIPIRCKRIGDEGQPQHVDRGNDRAGNKGALAERERVELFQLLVDELHQVPPLKLGRCVGPVISKCSPAASSASTMTMLLKR